MYDFKDNRKNMDTICLNKTVILQKGNILKAIKLVSDKIIVFEKLKFKPNNAAGHPYGTVFNGRRFFILL